MLKLVKLQSLAAIYCKFGKYSPAKFSNFVLICITRGKMHHIWAESFATKLCGSLIALNIANTDIELAS